MLARLRLARPGEFTERAFLNDKLDLAQAEAVADLIDASTEAAARSAARSLDGAFSREVDALADELIELRMLVEATLDFPEEEIEFLETRRRARPAGARARRGVDAVLGARAPGRAAARRHPRRAGRPAQRRQELAAQRARRRRAGDRHADSRARRATRSAQTIQIEGVPLHVVDTAGLRDAERRGRAHRRRAQLGRDRARRRGPLPARPDAARRARLRRRRARGSRARLPRAGRGRRPARPRLQQGRRRVADGRRRPNGARRSPRATGAGLDALRAALLARRRLAGGARRASSSPARATSRRLQRARALTSTHALAHAAAGNAALELFAEELRLAHDALGEITGAFTSDDLLGAIFGRFCIGK